MKIAVYTICKNEEKNVDDWLKSGAAADYRVIADTGSTDSTLSMFSYHSCRLHKISIDPWRFDDAHNAALALVPADADVCIPLHLDERLTPGWRDMLEMAWVQGTTKLFYTYIFSRNPDGTPELQFMQNRIHARKGYRWRYPSHEGIYPYGSRIEQTVTLPEFKIEHFQDRKKDRSSALDLLAMGVQEYPNDARMAHYYGRELMYYRRYKEALVHLERYMTIPTRWPHSVERAQNAECIAKCWRAIGG